MGEMEAILVQDNVLKRGRFVVTRCFIAKKIGIRWMTWFYIASSAGRIRIRPFLLYR